MLDEKLLKVYRNRRKALVYYNGEVIFSNINNDKKFRSWWRQFRKDNDLKKVSKKEVKYIERQLVIDKTAKLKQKYHIRKS